MLILILNQDYNQESKAPNLIAKWFKGWKVILRPRLVYPETLCLNLQLQIYITNMVVHDHTDKSQPPNVT